MRLRLREKGLILVMIPVCFQLIFTSTLLNLLSNADKEVRKAAYARDVHSGVNSFINAYQTAAFALVAYSTSKTAAMEKRYDNALTQIDAANASLRRLAAESSRKEKSLAAVSAINDQLRQTLGLVYDSVVESKNVDSLSKAALLSELSINVQRGLDKLRSFAEEEYELNAFDPGAEVRARELVLLWLGVGMLISIIVAFGMSVLFSNDIVSRIGIMVDNAKRLVQKQSLNPSVTGGDEIAFLDDTMHKMAQDLEEAARRKHELMSMVSHDLRSPLTSVGASIELVSQEVIAPLPEPVKNELAVCAGGVSRLVRMINDLLDMDKVEAGKLELLIEYVNLRPILAEACKSLEGICKRKGISTEIECDRIKVKADRDRVLQVIINLLSNAIKYSPAGGTVLLRGAISEGEVRIEVIDQGKGISKENQEKLFKRFEQVDAPAQRQADSTGLGLAICKSLVEMLGGRIGVTSNEGQGCNFWITLPLAPDEQDLSESTFPV